MFIYQCSVCWLSKCKRSCWKHLCADLTTQQVDMISQSRYNLEQSSSELSLILQNKQERPESCSNCSRFKLTKNMAFGFFLLGFELKAGLLFVFVLLLVADILKHRKPPRKYLAQTENIAINISLIWHLWLLVSDWSRLLICFTNESTK